MTAYQVSFFKNLLSSNGHPFRCLQDRVEVRNANSPAQAAARAAKKFEILHHIPIWNLRADSVDISEIREYAKRVSKIPIGTAHKDVQP